MRGAAGAIAIVIVLTGCSAGAPETPPPQAAASGSPATAAPTSALASTAEVPSSPVIRGPLVTFPPRRGDRPQRTVTVSGTVRTPAGVPVDGVRVAVYPAGLVCCLATATAVSADGGRYTFNVITGRYHVAFHPAAATSYLATWFGDVPNASCTLVSCASLGGVILRIGGDLIDLDVELVPTPVPMPAASRPRGRAAVNRK